MLRYGYLQRRPKARYFQLIINKVKSKLLVWKAYLLPIVGIVELFKSVKQGMPIHSIIVYLWLVSLLKDLEKYSRNFIWSEDVFKRNMFTVAWKNICMPYSKGGLGIKSIVYLNEASNMKLCWDFIHSLVPWDLFLQCKVLRSTRSIGNHIHSSIWSNIKQYYNMIYGLSSWHVQIDASINF